jgi:hypothetical protein
MSLSRGQAIAAKCYMCVRRHGHAARVLTDQCNVIHCPLHEFRPRLFPHEVLAELRATASEPPVPLRRSQCGCSAEWLATAQGTQCKPRVSA